MLQTLWTSQKTRVRPSDRLCEEGRKSASFPNIRQGSQGIKNAVFAENTAFGVMERKDMETSAGLWNEAGQSSDWRTVSSKMRRSKAFCKVKNCCSYALIGLQWNISINRRYLTWFPEKHLQDWECLFGHLRLTRAPEEEIQSKWSSFCSLAERIQIL